MTNGQEPDVIFPNSMKILNLQIKEGKLNGAQEKDSLEKLREGTSQSNCLKLVRRRQY